MVGITIVRKVNAVFIISNAIADIIVGLVIVPLAIYELAFKLRSNLF